MGRTKHHGSAVWGGGARALSRPHSRRKVLEGKGRISHEAAVKKVGTIYEEFRKKQDAEYISEFDRQIAAYLKGDKL